LLAHASLEKNLCIISGLPLNEKKIGPDNEFIHYLNIFRDRIAKERIRMLLFLHASNAAQFMGAAGDLWDFRHGTYWLEREKEESSKIHWDNFEKQAHALNDLDRNEIRNHLSRVRPLIDNTEESDEKARLLLDLARWLRRRYAYPLAIKTAYQAVDYTKGKRNSLRAEIEFELGDCLRLNSDLPEALDHYKQSLKIKQKIGNKAGQGITLNNISAIYHARGDYDTALKYLEQSLEIGQEIGDKAGEAVTCYNLAMEWERKKNIKKAILYLKRAVEIEEQTGHPDLVKNKDYLVKLIRRQQNNDKF
jgi:tetratricopeptide (TPR) repeat protein